MRLIDATALTAKLLELMKRYAEQGEIELAEGYNFAANVLRMAPTVNAITGVRCEECEYWNSESLWCGFWRKQKCSHEYCSNGIPKKQWERFTLEDGDEQ